MSGPITGSMPEPVAADCLRWYGSWAMRSRSNGIGDHDRPEFASYLSSRELLRPGTALGSLEPANAKVEL
jgi:hypothetical protein